ncbi:MAG: metal-sensitive transcriptional regulator [Deltaproteobacteria bacterium]|nr:metal-sensitive transcriptional regulator [Deltaproteobacteria bacterium]
MNKKVKAESVERLKKIEGQVRGVAKMVENEKYCIDIINQIAAAKNALDGVARIIMKKHVESCITQAILEGRAEEKIEELIAAVYKHGIRR